MRLAAALALLASISANAQAQQENSIVYATSYIEVLPASAAETSDVLKQLAEASRKEQGVLDFEIAEMVLPTNQFVIFEAWKDQQAYDTHFAGVNTKRAGAALSSVLIAPIDTRLATPMVGRALQVSPAGAIYGVTHIAVLPEKSDDMYAALVKYAAATRQAAGNLRYYPIRDSSRLNHFAMVEIWKDQMSKDTHEAAVPSKEFRAVLAPITGPHYDRRWYKAL